MGLQNIAISMSVLLSTIALLVRCTHGLIQCLHVRHVIDKFFSTFYVDFGPQLVHCNTSRLQYVMINCCFLFVLIVFVQFFIRGEKKDLVDKFGQSC